MLASGVGGAQSLGISGRLPTWRRDDGRLARFSAMWLWPHAVCPPEDDTRAVVGEALPVGFQEGVSDRSL